MSDEKGVTFAISGLKDRVLVYGLIILIGGSSALNIAVPKRPDPFTGSEGDELDDRITILEFELGLLKRSDSSCESRQEAFEEKLTKHLDYSAGKVDGITRQFATLQAEQKAQDNLIKTCMRRTSE